MQHYVTRDRKMELDKEQILQTDNGSELKNKMMKETCQRAGVKLTHSREYTPQTNGKVENRVRQVAIKVAAELGGDLKGKTEEDIKKALKSATHILNFTPSRITSVTPFEVSK